MPEKQINKSKNKLTQLINSKEELLFSLWFNFFSVK